MHRGLRKRWIFCETPVSIKSKDIMRIDSNSSGSTACLYNAQVYKRSSGKAYARWHHFLQAHPLASSFLYLTCCCCCCCWDALWRTGPVLRRKPVLTIYFVIPSFASFRRITKRLPNCPYSPIFFCSNTQTLEMQLLPNSFIPTGTYVVCRASSLSLFVEGNSIY